MRVFLAAIFFVIIISNASGQDKVDYIRTKEFKRMSLIQEDFKSILKSIKYYYVETTRDTLDKYDKASFKCELIGKDKALTFSSLSQIEDFEIKSEAFTSILLRYNWDKKPISSITIDLNNYYRKVSITGNDEKKVDALYMDILNQLEAKQLFLSSLDLPTILGFMSVLLFSLSVNIFIRSMILIIDKTKDKRTYITSILSLLIILITIGFFFSPYQIRDFFPGFQLTSDNTTWWDKNQSFIGFISFIGSVFLFIYKSLWKLWNSNPKTLKSNR